MSRRIHFMVLGCLLACGSGEPDVAVVARVNGEAITLEEFEAEVARLPQALRDRLRSPEQRARYLDELVDRRLLLQAARERGLDQDAELVAKIRELEQRLLIDAVQRAVAAEAAKQDAARSYYDQHRDEYTQEQVRVRQILVREEARARELHAQLAQGADFIALAREHSVDPTARRGGDLGYVPRGRMDPAFEAAAFALASPGDLSDVVRTRLGYHVIQLVERPASRTLPFEQVKLSIEQRLRSDAVEAYTASLRERASIEIVEAGS